MEPISIGFVISAFVAGMLTFLAPCTLPLVPGYLGFISGVSPDDIKNSDMQSLVRKKILRNAVFFILGFSLVFILFGAFAGFFGAQLAVYRTWLARIGGVFVIMFGLFMLGVFKFSFLQGTHRLKMPTWLTVGKPTSSMIIGSAFAFGWTPCVGPILGSILLLSTTTGGALQGAFMLAVFSAGLAVPFIVVAFAYASATSYIARASSVLKWVSIVGGVFLVFLGILLVTNNFSLLVEWGFRLLGFIEYDALLNLL